MEIIHSFQRSKDMFLFNIMNIHLHIFNLAIKVLQLRLMR